MNTKFELEEKIMSAWQTETDLELLYRNLDNEMSKDEIHCASVKHGKRVVYQQTEELCQMIALRML